MFIVCALIYDTHHLALEGNGQPVVFWKQVLHASLVLWRGFRIACEEIELDLDIFETRSGKYNISHTFCRSCIILRTGNIVVDLHTI